MHHLPTPVRPVPPARRRPPGPLHHAVLVPVARVHARVLTGSGRVANDRRLAGSAGQTTAEYALVLLGAATLALLLITWATKTDRVGKLLDFVFEQITGRAR